MLAQGSAPQAAGVAQSPPQDPAPAPKTDDKKTKTKDDRLDHLRIRMDGHEQHITNPASGPATRGFFPLVGTVVSGSGVSAGLDYQNLRPGRSPIGFDVSAEVSYLTFQLYTAQVGYLKYRDTTETLRAVDAKVTSLFNDHALKSPGIAAYASARYLRYPAAVFYGVGPGAPVVDRADYLLLGTLVDGVVQYQFTRTFGVAGRVGLLAPDIGGGADEAIRTRFSPGTAPGVASVPRFVTTGFAAALDARDDPSEPHRGSFLGTAIWLFDELGGTDYNFVRVTGDARWYHTLFGPKRVLALRALTSTERPTAGAEVPFYLQQTLGGNEILRGFAPYRFRDRALAAASAEYRWRVSSYLDVGPFLDAGAVASTFGELASGNLEWSAGVRAGIRYKGRVLFNIGWGHSREGDRFYIGAGNVY
jgi:hypothetical protein